jgi:hypothetical protein
MVLLVLSAMAVTTKFLYPHIYAGVDDNSAERYRALSEYLLLNEGAPSNWGQNSTTALKSFGLAKADSNIAYELDIDKVSKLNSENLYAVSYAQIFTALKMSDASFRIEIKPVFQVTINLTATFEKANETAYQFEISTMKHGTAVYATLKCYAVAEDYLWTSDAYDSNGIANLNVTLPNSVNGPALLIVFAKSASNDNIASFNTYGFAQNSPQPTLNDDFLRLSPRNYSLTASHLHSGISLSKAYALTYDYSSILSQTASGNQSATFSVPHFLDSSSMLLVVTGYNSTTFFTESTTYPQIPIQVGTDFTMSTSLSNVFTYTHLVTIGSAIYECTIWLGGPNS